MTLYNLYSYLSNTTTALLVIVILVFYYFSTSTYDHWRKRNVPYYRPIPLFGNFIEFAFGLKNMAFVFEKLYRHPSNSKYVGIYQMRSPHLLVRDPELIHNILIKDFSNFINRGIPIDVEAAPIANHLFFMNGQQWRIMRNKMSPVFTSRMLKNMYDQIKDCSNVLLENIDTKLKQNNILEVRSMLGDYSTDVIGTCAFGLKLNSITDTDSPFRKAGKAVFNPTFETLLSQMVTMISPSLKKILHLQDMPASVVEFFKTAFSDTIKYREDNNILRNDLVQCLMQANTDLVINKKEPSVEFKYTDIVANAFIMFLAGFETVSSTMSFCLYEIALNKSIQDRVREEMVNLLEKHNKEINKEFLSELYYLEMVISETLRKYPPGNLLFREALEDYPVSDDNFIIEKGTKLIIPIYSLHMDSKYFPDPMKFDPNRFTAEEKTRRLNCTYIPFGDGPRFCIGKRFAEMEMKLALTELLTRYEVEPCVKTDVPLEFQIRAPIFTPKNGIWLKFNKLSFVRTVNTMLFNMIFNFYDIVTILVFIVTALFYYFITSTHNYWRKLNVPHYHPLPLFGNMFYFVIGSKNLAQSFNDIYKHPTNKKYVGFYQMRTPTLLIRDPELIRRILIKDFTSFVNRDLYIDTEGTPLLNHLFFMKDEQWKIMRHKLSPAFTSRMLKNMYDQIKECSAELLVRIDRHLEKCSIIEVRNMMGDYSTDVIGTCAFGLKLNSIKDCDSPFRKAGRASINPTLMTILAQILGMISPRLKNMLNLKELPLEVLNFFELAFDDTMKNRENSNILRNDLVDFLIQANNDLVVKKTEPSVAFKYTDIIANAFLMFFAGFETISSTISFCLYELALNESIQNCVREELIQQRAKHNNQISSDFLSDLHYLNMVIAETLRKYPVAPNLIRKATSNYEVPDDDLVIEKGTQVIIPVYSIHMDPKYYPDPNTFNPERFDVKEKAERPNCTYLPFGDGPRICLGKRFAEMEIKLALVEILSKYKAEPCEKTDVPLMFLKKSIFLNPKNGIWLKFKSISA
ncbi:uncharacterized protein LOC126898087 [Daktulosphaira vitifoliae]|uniref:uncharacterized protein LOC126898087 n=1 Tax=Daktulosphaira vitifoliae TaxID=58002 RepID=UPI0021AA154F|nr:uncharacterized protein LOC126898087 [Daktulosphaira vitifoliae]